MDAPRNAHSSDWFPARGRANGPLLRDLFYLALAIRALAVIPVLWAFAAGEPPYLGGDWGAFHEWAKGILLTSPSTPQSFDLIKDFPFIYTICLIGLKAVFRSLPGGKAGENP